eukprot:m.47631 g.47631  ORF g.47631 m.47631 type:complete len:73 (-) comp10987_c0_seq2:875-1093(-)
MTWIVLGCLCTRILRACTSRIKAQTQLPLHTFVHAGWVGDVQHLCHDMNTLTFAIFVILNFGDALTDVYQEV